METRLKTGWLIPVVAIWLATRLAQGSGPGVQVDSGDGLVFAGFFAAGMTVGLLWQWYSPRDAGDRLAVPMLLATAAVIFLAIPGISGTLRPGEMFLGIGVIAGLVFHQFIRGDDAKGDEE